MAKNTRFVGLDVHAETVAVAVARTARGHAVGAPRSSSFPRSSHDRRWWASS